MNLVQISKLTEITQMANTAKYHQQYYEKNKEKLREKAREREKQKRNLAKAFVKTSTPVSSKSLPPSAPEDSLQTMVTAYAIPPLLLLSTFLMIREMANVYAETWGTLGAIMVALTIEGFTLLFSFVRAPSLALKICLRGLAVILALGSIYGMSANHFSAGLSSYRSDRVTERTITDLETTIKRKQAQSDALSARGRITAARKLETQVDAMRMELAQFRNKIASEKPAAAVASTTFFEIFIRFVLSICNILAAHLFGASLKKLENFKAAHEIPWTEMENSRPDNLKFLASRKPARTAFQDRFVKTFKHALGYESG
jgi:hypothetical protein